MIYVPQQSDTGWRGGGDDRECLIEIYHYTLICEIYCAAIERQQREAGSATHTLKSTRMHTHMHTLGFQWGSNRGCECISRYSPSVKCWPGV